MLSIALAMNGKKVVLLDADLGLANVHILLGIAPGKSIADVVEGKCSLRDCIIRGPQGISIIPGASGLESLANVEQSRLELLYHQFRELEQEFDFLLIDTGAGIGSTVIQFASKADCMLLIMTPDPASLADAYALVKIVYERGQSKIGAIVNMAMSEREGIETFDRINTIVVKFLKKPLELYGCLPMSKELQRMIRMQKIMSSDKTDGWIGRLQLITRKICGLPCEARESFFSRLLGGFNNIKAGE
jgi:flagellar biosynthesis protein FlhG